MEPDNLITIDAAFQMLLPSQHSGQARVLLQSAIAADEVSLWANGKKVAPDFFESHLQITVKTIDGDDNRWTAELTMQKAVENFFTTEWRVSRSGVVKLLERLAEQASGGRKRGRKVKFDWDKIVAEVIRHIHIDGVPDNDSALARTLQEWCQNHFEDEGIPELKTLETKLRIWFESVRADMRHPN
jgi:hypothetical protein